MEIISIKSYLTKNKTKTSFKKENKNLLNKKDILWNSKFKTKTNYDYQDKIYVLMGERDISKIYSVFWKNDILFRKKINSLSLDDKHILMNVPKCIRISNNNLNYLKKEKYPSFDNYFFEYSQAESCKKCVYFSKCKWIHASFIKAYWEKLLQPIMDLSSSIRALEYISSYVNYYSLENLNKVFNNSLEEKIFPNNPPKVDHYFFVLDYILSNFKPEIKILEFWSFLGLFVDLLLKIWYKNILWIDNIDEYTKLWKMYWLPVKKADIYYDHNFNFDNVDLIIMIWVLHNDYPGGAYWDITIENYCYTILKNCFQVLKKGWIMIFTTSLFELDQKEIQKIGFSIKDFFLEKWSQWLFYYTVKNE